MREKPTSRNRKPTCMNITRIAATITQTRLDRRDHGCPLSGVSIAAMVRRAGLRCLSPAVQDSRAAGCTEPARDAVVAHGHHARLHAARQLARVDARTGCAGRRRRPRRARARAATRRRGPAGRARTAARRRSRSRWRRAPRRRPAWRTSATSSASASLSVSMRWRPEATQTTGSPSATNTIDLAISDSWQPTATAASLTVRVDAPRR